jgi:ferredoxin
VSPDELAAFVGEQVDREFFLCGPTGFMDVVEGILRALDVPAERIHVERFTPVDVGPDGPGGQDGHGDPDRQDDEPSATTAAVAVTIHVGGRSATVTHRAGTTILQAARSTGLRVPSSCESGSCATCMARVTEGRAEMRHNEALTDAEVAEGWVLTCQAEPVTPAVTVVYE